MAGRFGGGFLDPIRTLFDVGTTAGLTDGQLLERFATRRDAGAELAFAALVERHGPMVLRVCRSVLRDEHDAADAFQATFLVLARKGAALWVEDSIGPWLFRVAGRASVRAARLRTRRRAADRRAAEHAVERVGAAPGDDLSEIVRAEVDRLPERFRSVIVLCDLEGRTCEEAARSLGCPVGTVGSRLARGRERLRHGLTRRGLAPRDASVASTLAAWRAGGVLPPAIASSTVEAALRFVTIRAASAGAAVPLALGVLREMSVQHGWKIVSALAAACVATTGIVLSVGPGASVAQARGDDPPKSKLLKTDGHAVATVKSGPFRFDLEGRGSLEASKSADVLSMVEGTTTVVHLLPEGTRVKKGQVVGRLDSAQLKDRLENQKLALEGATEAVRAATAEREMAEIALVEYERGTALQQREKLMGEIGLARDALSRGGERSERAKAAKARLDEILKGKQEATTPADLVAQGTIDDRVDDAERSLSEAKLAFQDAQAKLRILEEFTRPRTLRKLNAEIQKAVREELRLQAARRLEEAKLGKLKEQIAACELLSPADGVVVYANDPGRVVGRPQIEEGATVRERQIIFSVPDLDAPFRVAAKVPEAYVDQVARGQTVRVKIDAFPDQVFEGVVSRISPLPDPASFTTRGVKVYSTWIDLSKSFPGLRPGMTASAEILIKSVPSALTVPLEAVVRVDGKYRVAVRRGEGGAEWREVELGAANPREVVIVKGLSVDETVVLNPGDLLTDAEKAKTARPGR